MNEAVHPLRRTMDHLQLSSYRLVRAIAGSELFEQELHRHLNRRQRILQVVRNDSHHLLARASGLFGGAIEQRPIDGKSGSSRELVGDGDITNCVSTMRIVGSREHETSE